MSKHLPGIVEWEEYMDVTAVSAFPHISINDFLMNYEFGKLLSEGKTSEFETFRLRCREFIDRLILLLLKTTSATSAISKGLYSFCPELMLEGDHTTAFALFAGLCKVLETCGVIPTDVSKAAVEEYTSYVVERRKTHLSSGQSASGVTDVVQHLLLDFGFQARHRLLRVFKLCCLFVGMPAVKYPVVTFDLNGSALESRSFQDCLRLVQSYVMCAGYSPRRLFSDQTVRAVRRAVADSGVFFVTAGYDLWKNFCKTDKDVFAARYVTLYNTILNERRKAFDAEYSACNVANRLPRVRSESKASGRLSRSECGSDVASSTSSVGTVIQKKGTAGSSKEKTSETSRKKKNSQPQDKDPEVLHKLKKATKH